MDETDPTAHLLARTRDLAASYLAGLGSRPVPARAGTDDLLAAFTEALHLPGADPVEVVEELSRLAEPGLTAVTSPRFFGSSSAARTQSRSRPTG